MEGVQSLKTGVVRLTGQIALIALLAWTAALPFAQIQKTRFTSIFLFVLLGVFLIRFAFEGSFRTIPAGHRRIALVLILFALIPAIDFFRWPSAKAGEEAILLRLPFVVVPFLVVQFEKNWHYNWRKTAILVLLGSFLFCMLLMVSQGIDRVYLAARTDVKTGIHFILHRPYTGMVSGIFFWLAMGLFWPSRWVWILFSALLFGGLQFLVLSKFSLIACLGSFLIFWYFSYPAHSPGRKWLLSVFLLSGLILGYKISNTQAFREFISTGGIDFQTLSKTYANSINTRSQLWQGSADLLAKDHNWIFGLGTGNFQKKLDLEVGKYGDYLPSQHLNPHNIFLYYWLQYGLAGLILLIVFFRIWFAEAAKTGKRNLPYLAAFMLLCCQTEIFLDRELGIQLFVWMAVVLFWDRPAFSPASEPPFLQS
jgi:hypothetical protein